MTKIFKLVNKVTGEVAQLDHSPTALKNYAIKIGLVRVENSKSFSHLSWGDWAIERVQS